MARPRAGWPALVVGAALALVACGDETPAGTTTTTTTTTGGATSSTTGVVASDDRAKAETLLLQKADVPDDFSASPHQEDPSERQAAEELSACAGLPDPATVNEIELHGPDLAKGEFIQVTSTVTVVKTEQNARDDLAAVTGPKFPGCVKDQITKGIREVLGGAAVKDASVDSVDVGKFGDATNAVRSAVTVEIGDRSLTATADTVLLIKGRFEVTLTFLSFDEPFDIELERELVAAVGKRLEALP